MCLKFYPELEERLLPSIYCIHKKCWTSGKESQKKNAKTKA